MSIRVSGTAMGAIQTLFERGAMGAWSDSQLIEQFLAGQEESEAAFRVLIHRHGPMVLGICRRILGNEHAAEDAFQATFLVLVKKAGMLKDRGLLTNWLYGVALRVSHKERARGERRRVVERHAAEQATWVMGVPEPGELRWVIDEEIRRLPERYRVPLLLCHVEGLRHDEVARRLGCPVGTVESRLSRARDQLRTRLARRGLAPTASAIAGLLRPPGIGAVPASLLASTLRSALEAPIPRAGLLTVFQSGLGRLGLAARSSSTGLIKSAAGMVIGVGIVAVGLCFLRAEEPMPPAPPAGLPGPQPAPQKVAIAGEGAAVKLVTTPRRKPQAIARPMSGITIDGKLDDWPGRSRVYPIANLLTDRKGSYRDTIEGHHDVNAEFMAGYDTEAGLLYLAVVVRDDEHVVGRSGSPVDNDAVEVYVDGAFSDRRIEGPSSGDWRDALDASAMPVLQYVGLTGEAPAYGDPFGANPALVYAKTREPSTQMKARRWGDVTTYEWAIQVYESFPNKPTRLEPGKRIGLEVAVVDRDRGRSRPAFLTWGAPPANFKGFDAGSLGELRLSDRP